jgi:hypothetical protein
MQALRHLFNRMLGQLHHCLLARSLFDEAIDFPTNAATGSLTGVPPPAQP